MADMHATPTRTASLWRNRDYLLLWGGQAISSIGCGVTQIAWPLLTLAVTRSPAQAGFVGAVRALIYVLLVLPAGALLDRWDRKRAMILCASGCALVLVSIPLALVFGHLTLAHIYLATLIEGARNVFFSAVSGSLRSSGRC
ncbi:MAG: MFS transporter [Ktedonobacterales bacterium]